MSLISTTNSGYFTNLHFFLDSLTSEVKIWLLGEELMEIVLFALCIIFPSRSPKNTFLQIHNHLKHQILPEAKFLPTNQWVLHSTSIYFTHIKLKIKELFKMHKHDHNDNRYITTKIIQANSLCI